MTRPAAGLFAFLAALMLVVAYAAASGGEPIAAGLAVGVLGAMAWECWSVAR